MAEGNRLGRRHLLLAVSVGVLGLYDGASLKAATTNYYFDPGALKAIPGSGGTGSWDLSTADWYVSGATDSIFASSATATAAIFQGSGGTVTLNSSLSALQANFNTAGYTVNSTGTSALTLGTGGLVSNASGGATVFNIPIIVGGNQVWTAGTAALPDTMNFTGNISGGSYALTTGGNTGTVGFGTYNFSGASFTTSNKVTLDGTVNWSVGTATIAGQPEGIGSGQSGTFSMTGGVTTVTPGTGYYLFIGNGAVGAINISGGTLNAVSSVSNSGVLLGDGYNNTGANGGTGTLTVSNGGNFNTGTGIGVFSLGNGGNGIGEVDLNSGGTISTLRTISKGSGGTGGTGTATVNFNGGNLQATGSSLALTGLTRANVRAGGAICNTGGFNVTIAQSLLHSNLAADSSLTTDGGLTKNGAGILTLTGTNTWYGATTVNAGTLKAGSLLAFPSSTVASGAGALVVGAAGTLDFGGQYNAASGTTGGGLLVPSLSLTSGGTLNFDFNGGSADQLTITGASNSAGGLISVGTSNSSAGIPSGAYTLISDSSVSSNLSGFTLATSRVASGGLIYPLSLSASANSDVLTVGSGQLTSYYFVGQIDGNWNTLNASNQSNFATNASGLTPATSLPGTISDVYLVANNSGNFVTTLGQNFTINSLTFTGTNTPGTNPVSVGGNNTLTIQAAAGAYNAGTGIIVSSGAGADTIIANLALGANQSFTNNTAAANPFTISGNVNLGTYTLTTLGSGLTAISGNVTGSGGINASAGTLVLSGTSTYTGPTVIAGSILNASSFGVGGSPSALGASSNAAANLVLSGATLQYNGSGGVITDRLFTIGTAGGANTATIDASDTGTGVNFNNSGPIAFTNSAAHTLTLQGTSANGNLFSPSIRDQSSGNATSVVKAGVGTWQLNGTSSYSGGTTITGGDLLVSTSSALGTGLVTDNGAGSAALTGTLQLAGGITITNALNPFGDRTDPATTSASPQLENISGNNTITSQLNSTGGGAGVLIKSDAGTLTLSGNLINTSGSAYSRPYYLYGAGNGVISGMLTDTGNSASNGVSVTVEGSGTWTLTNSNNYSGGTTISAGTLQLGDGTSGHDGTITNGSITDNGTLAFNRFGALTSSRNILGTGVVTMSGTGSQTLTGTDTYSGGTNVSSGTLTFGGPASYPTNTLLNISSGAIVTAANHGTNPKINIIASGLSIVGTGKLDLNNNDLLVQNGNLATITANVASGYANGTWTGTGITSSAAGSDTTHLTALGVIQNSNNGTSSGTVLYGNFDSSGDGAITDVLVKFTYYGDTDLNGEVDGTDYSRIDNAYLNNQNASNIQLTGWFNGDFNYDNVINGSDYTLIDNAFNSQGATIAAELASPTAVATDQIAGSGSTSAVPEPASLGILGLGFAGLLGRRRHFNKHELRA